jgi:hypothetical protein
MLLPHIPHTQAVHTIGHKFRNDEDGFLLSAHTIQLNKVGMLKQSEQSHTVHDATRKSQYTSYAHISVHELRAYLSSHTYSHGEQTAPHAIQCARQLTSSFVLRR